MMKKKIYKIILEDDKNTHEGLYTFSFYFGI